MIDPPATDTVVEAPSPKVVFKSSPVIDMTGGAVTAYEAGAANAFCKRPRMKTVTRVRTTRSAYSDLILKIQKLLMRELRVSVT